MMKITVLLFGITKDLVGNQFIELELESKLTVSQFKAVLMDKYPELSDLNSLAIAVNNEYATDEVLINQHDEIALIPPVSGG